MDRFFPYRCRIFKLSMGSVDGNKKIVPELRDFSKRDFVDFDGAIFAWPEKKNRRISNKEYRMSK
jgi:hypothetical protein